MNVTWFNAIQDDFFARIVVCMWVVINIYFFVFNIIVDKDNNDLNVILTFNNILVL